MVTSQNGWPAGERDAVDLTTITVPGTKAKLPVKAGDVATVLLWVATRWHNEVEPLVEPGNWGYAYRPVRGATSGLSNHASGTAIDLNAPKHPLGTEPLATLSKAQVAAAKRIEADTGGVVRWGGSYTGRKDSMHWEINAGPAAVAAFARRISGGTSPAPSGGLFVSLSNEEERRVLAASDKLAYFLDTIKANTDYIPAMANAVSEIHWGVLDEQQGLRVAVSGLYAKLAGGTQITAVDIAALIPDRLAKEVADELATRLAA